jgi:hypothetical protein
VDRQRIAPLVLGTALVVSLSLVAAGPAAAAKPQRSATVTMSFTVVDGRCYPTETATWSGYQVNRVRFLGYREGRSGDDVAWLDTKSYPQGVSEPSGTMISVATIAARPGEGWYAYAIFRSNGGARLAEVQSPVVYAPADCLYP